jgi:hypothetical protein
VSHRRPPIKVLRPPPCRIQTTLNRSNMTYTDTSKRTTEKMCLKLMFQKIINYDSKR